LHHLKQGGEGEDGEFGGHQTLDLIVTFSASRIPLKISVVQDTGTPASAQISFIG